MNGPGVDWLASYGPAEYNRALCPPGAKKAPEEQGGLFIVAREPRRPKREERPPELPGQVGMFGEDEEGFPYG